MFPRSVWKTAERQVNLAAESSMDWNSARHPGDVTKNVVAMSDDVILNWTETSLVCNVSTMDAIRSSDAK